MRQRRTEIGDFRAYEVELRRLEQSSKYRGRFEGTSNNGLSLDGMAMGSHKFCKVLARTVRRDAFQMGPCFARVAFVGGKDRVLYRYDLVDNIVEGVVARALGERVRSSLVSGVYSYLKGRSAVLALRDFAAYIRKHVKAHPIKKDRGLFVLRRSIQKYGESIPTDEASPLWTLLDPVFSEAKDGAFERLVRRAIRPDVVKPDGTVQPLQKGIPTGSKIQPVICNLYLRSLDEALTHIEGGFYARYGDDILFAHPNAPAIRRAEGIISDAMGSLKLALNTKKCQNLYFTKPGRPSPDPAFHRGSSVVEYLGCGVGFDGGVRLKQKKTEALLKDLRGKFWSTRRMLFDLPRPSLVDALCDVANGTLSPAVALCHPTAVLLNSVVDNRGQLKHIDYLVAKMIAEIAAGRRGVRAFREVSYRSLRRTHRLVSLVAQRNAGRAKS